MKHLILIPVIFLTGCCFPWLEVDTFGVDGANGHSVLSESSPASVDDCPNGGTKLDLYLDVDNTKTITVKDTYEGSVLACNGANGDTGLQGPIGATGDTGPVGETGPTGPQGLPGEIGPIGPQGPNGDIGATGPQGPIGNTGAVGGTGPQGPAGNTGSTGPQGEPGQSVTGVKFCPNVADVHSSTFPEYGLCLDNKIYAVYWSGSQAFLAYLTPGNYSTTSINSNCNFTVTLGSCVVSH